MSFFRSRKYFGEPLENIQRRKTGQYNHRLPSLVHLCGTYLSEPNHVKVEGIFRHSAETNKIEKVKKIINTKSVVGSKAVLIRAFDEDIHICTSVLKQFLVELPTPIINKPSIDALKRIVTGSNTTKASRDLFSSLPQASADLLAYLLIFLNYVASFSAFNKMDAHGLAVCFTPALIRLNPNSEDYYSVDTFVSAIKILITQSKQFIPRYIYSVFCVAFANAQPVNSPQKQQIQQTKVSPVPNIHTQEDILDYVYQDRQLFHRPQQWADMTYPQLIQEYSALKTATSCFYYNSYFKTGTWPDDNDCLNVLNTITELKRTIKMQSSTAAVPDTFRSYHVSSKETELALPQTLDSLASFVSDVQTEMISIQGKLNALPDQTTLLERNDHHTLAERKLLVAKLTVCLLCK